MSYDLAVWEGNQPASDAVAGEEFGQLYDRYIDSGDLLPPTPRIAAYIRALLDRYPDINDDAREDSPWADGPLMRDASGPVLYFPLVYSQCDEASAWAAQLARDHGRVCYDVHIGKLTALTVKIAVPLACHYSRRKPVNHGGQRLPEDPGQRP